MLSVRSRLHVVLGVAVALGVTLPASATTLIRAGIEDLVARNPTVVIGEVVDARSYWNQEGSFIFTDVQVKVIETVSGAPNQDVLTVTLMGGTVGDLTTLILGAPELTLGSSYMLFVGLGDLPGARSVRTIKEHAQGVFDIVHGRDGLRAVSQANSLSLVPDREGEATPPGGADGLLLEEMIRSVRATAAPGRSRPEVK